MSNELRKQGTFVSPTGVRSVWLRHDLQTFKRRLAGLEKKSAEEGLVLTEKQIVAIERKREEQLECGEIETAHLAIWDRRIRVNGCACIRADLLNQIAERIVYIEVVTLPRGSVTDVS